jgi:hypothetical protein
LGQDFNAEIRRAERREKGPTMQFTRRWLECWRRGTRGQLALLRRESRAFGLINATFFGIMIGAMVYVAGHPDVQARMIQDAIRDMEESWYRGIREAYTTGRFALAAILTFAFNLAIGGILYGNLFSAAVPFLGLFYGWYRALRWGLLLMPLHPMLGPRAYPHMLTLLLEGEAYVLIMLAVYLHGRGILLALRRGGAAAWAAHLDGVRATARIYWLAIPLLAVAAVYEVVEVIWFGRMFLE